MASPGRRDADHASQERAMTRTFYRYVIALADRLYAFAGVKN